MKAPDGIAALRNFIDQQTDPAQKAALARAVEAFEGMLRDSTCDTARLGAVVEVAGAKERALWDAGTEMLVELASRHELAREAFVALARSRKAGQRYAAIALVDDRLPRPLVLDVLKAGLTDTSTKVRDHAFVRCNDLAARELVDEMAKVAATLAGKARESAEFYLALTRDGYLVKPGGTSASVVFMAPGRMISRFVSPDEVTPDRIAATVARLRKEDEEEQAELARIRAISAR